MKPIPTQYNGIKFRSKMEAQWAEQFDINTITWVYEKQGFSLNNGQWYLPDFYLPEINTVIEVKGIMERIDKAYQFYSESIQARKDKKQMLSPSDTMFLLAGPEPYFYNIDSEYSCGLWERSCDKCGKTSILTELGNYSCRACGDHSGGHHPGHIEDLPVLMKPIEWSACEPEIEVIEIFHRIFHYKII